MTVSHAAHRPRSRVFVTQASDANVLPAQAFGELVFLLPRDHVVGLHGQAALDQALTKLATASERDWFLPVGDPVAISLLAAAFAERVGRLRLLKWDRQEKRYYPVELATESPPTYASAGG
jgi:hypothetical protein